MGFTHKKRPYKAQALQWDGSNTQEVIDVLASIDAFGTKYGEDHMIVRHSNTIDTLIVGSWVVRGENGMVKCYSDSEFNVKYEEV